MSGGGGTQESKTTTEISPDFKPFIQYALGQAKDIYQGMPQAPETLAVGPSAATQQALGMAEQRAMAGSPLLSQAQGAISGQLGYTSPYAARIESLGMGAADPSGAFYQSMMAGNAPSEAQEMARRTASGAFLESNPFLQGALSQANRLATESYQEGLRGLQSQASAAGRYGSGAMGQQVSRGQDVFARALAEQNQQAFLQMRIRSLEDFFRFNGILIGVFRKVFSYDVCFRNSPFNKHCFELFRFMQSAVCYITVVTTDEYF